MNLGLYVSLGKSFSRLFE